MKYIKIKNWEKFQHYKDRTPPWIKLHRDLLTDYDFSVLPDALKGQLSMLWILASQLDNNIPNDIKFISNKINATCDVDIGMLIDRGFIYLSDVKSTQESEAGDRYISKEIKEIVTKRDGDRCTKCGSQINVEFDRVVPASKGGASTEHNLQLMCASCSRKKRRYKPVEQSATQLRSLETETEAETEAEGETENTGARRRKKPPSPEQILPEWLPAADWQDFVDHRKQIKKPLTDGALKRCVNDLAKLRAGGENIAAVLNSSIVNGWAGLFAVKKQNNGYQQTSKQASISSKSMANLTSFFTQKGDGNEQKQ